MEEPAGGAIVLLYKCQKNLHSIKKLHLQFPNIARNRFLEEFVCLARTGKPFPDHRHCSLSFHT
jgi:hypothetical protein